MEKGPQERLYFDKKELAYIERDIAHRRHIERYTMLRQWCYGVVVDCACGCGYGTNLISKNPDVSYVYGIDISKSAIAWANKNFAEENITFINDNMVKLTKYITDPIDVFVSIETIEHIKETNEYLAMIQKTNPTKILLSYPIKKSTHYNKYHYYDFKEHEIITMFTQIGYRMTNVINLYQEVALCQIEKQ